jgi:hypothetical protein
MAGTTAWSARDEAQAPAARSRLESDMPFDGAHVCSPDFHLVTRWRRRLLAALSALVFLASVPLATAEQRFTGVWRGGTDGYYLWVGVDWDSFVQKWQELAGQNLRLIDFETYEEGGVRKYAGVWREGSGAITRSCGSVLS